MLGRLITTLAMTCLFGISGHALADQREQEFRAHVVENPQTAKGQVLRDMAGVTIGEISNVVQDEGTDDIYLVVTPGDYLRSGDALTAVRLEDVRSRDGNIVLNSRGTHLPLAIQGYDETLFKDFRYTAGQAADYTVASTSTPED